MQVLGVLVLIVAEQRALKTMARFCNKSVSLIAAKTCIRVVTGVAAVVAGSALIVLGSFTVWKLVVSIDAEWASPKNAIVVVGARWEFTVRNPFLTPISLPIYNPAD